MTFAASRFARQLSRLPRPLKFAILVLLDLLIFYGAAVLAIVLRYSDSISGLGISQGIQAHLLTTLLAPLVGVILLTIMRVYSEVLRYSTLKLAGRIAIACLLLTIVMVSFSFIFDRTGNQSRSVLIMLGVLSFLGIWPLRLMAKYFLSIDGQADSVKALIYGAGVAGAGLAAALTADARWSLVGFVDDDKRHHGRKVAGLKVYSSDMLPRLAKETGFKSVFLALPSVDGDVRKAIIDRLRPLNAEILTVPTMEELVAGQANFRDLRQLDMEDLLGRTAVSADERLVLDAISGKSVLVTGGGGSIGSELCRQILKAAPRRLIVLDQSEFNLYRIGSELPELIKDRSVRIECMLGSVLDQAFLDEVFNTHHVDVVFHAAAYKHVPIVEHNVVAGVETNVIGTLQTVDTAIRHQVERFILVSTDKAVRPTNAMGASKRIAEIVVQDRAATLESRGDGPSLGIVRFGNVIDSSGSVVPRFRSQIERGGPITVTHPDITRFFMMIPEAAELVIQAAAMTEGGDVFLLDMGDPVKIVDLARTLIELNGLTVKDTDHPEGDIEIEFIGLRPGEKIFEELLIGDNASPSDHERIFRAIEESFDHSTVQNMIDEISTAIGRRDVARLRDLLKSFGNLKGS